MACSESKTLKDSFVFELVSSSQGDLTAFERLYVINKLSYTDNINKRWLADLYMRCGCFSEAKKVYDNLGHWRKLGDLAWINNDLVSAEYYYSKDEDRNSSVFRGSKDWDRLIKLAFHQSEWEKLIKITFESNLSAFGNDIILGSSGTSSKPYLKMLALAIVKCKMENDLAVTRKVLDSFPIDRQDWNQLLDSVSVISQQEAIQMQKKVIPRATKTRLFALDEVLKKGDTGRANQISRAIECIDITLDNMADRLRLFLTAKDKTVIQHIVELINNFSDESLAKTFIKILVSKTHRLFNEISDCHLAVEFYESHPLIRRLYFGDLLRLKFENSIRVRATDIYTGLLQYISSIEADIADISNKTKKEEKLLEFNKLVAYYDWIEIKLDTWMESEGNAELQKIIGIWNGGETKPVRTLFDPTKRYPKSPREMIEWVEFLKKFHRWITKCWLNEIGVERWKSEKSLFDIVKKHFKGFDVLRHTQPIWLEPQHLDIFLPELSLALEYMGEQHYRPIEYFGGKEGFEATIARDKRKAEICNKAGVNLIYIHFDDDINKRVEQVVNIYNTKRG
jgi:hypothetical protein